MYRDETSRASSRRAELVLGRFALQTELGSGSFARVWQAEDTVTGHCVVVKIAHARLCSRSNRQILVARFQAEYDAVSRVDHPNVVKMLAIGETGDGRPTLVMEYVPGQSLGRILTHRAPLPMKVVAPVIKQVASALEAAHAVDVIHRDVSPDNVLVAPHRQSVRVSLVDFGVARLDDETQHTLGPIGTPGYMAPEQILGDPQPASDLFSLGALLWWALTGEQWLGDTVQSINAMLTRQVEMCEVPDPGRLCPGLDPRLRVLMRALLDPRPERRPTARELSARWQRLTALRGDVSRPAARVPSTLSADGLEALREVVPVRLAESLDPGRTRALRMASLRALSEAARRAGALELAETATATADVLPQLHLDVLATRVAELERQFGTLTYLDRPRRR